MARGWHLLGERLERGGEGEEGASGTLYDWKGEALEVDYAELNLNRRREIRMEIGLELAAPDEDCQERPDMSPFTRPFRAFIVARASELRRTAGRDDVTDHAQRARTAVDLSTDGRPARSNLPTRL
jgi:hypothetical protein